MFCYFLFLGSTYSQRCVLKHPQSIFFPYKLQLNVAEAEISIVAFPPRRIQWLQSLNYKNRAKY